LYLTNHIDYKIKTFLNYFIFILQFSALSLLKKSCDVLKDNGKSITGSGDTLQLKPRDSEQRISLLCAFS